MTIGVLSALAHKRPLPYLAALLAISVVANVAFRQPVARDWIPLDTQLGPAKDSSAEYDRLQALLAMVSKASASNPHAAVFVLPELVGGDWSMNSIWWTDLGAAMAERGQTALIGALLPYDRNQRYVNALFSIGHDDALALVDRVPVPISMWKPWAGAGAKAYWWNTGVVTIANRRAASLICYEQLLVWPVLVSMANRPEILVGAANDWWAQGTSIPHIQRQVTDVWARLFGIPSVWVTNQ
ncbi:nitrilase-related carbon-nitrogen hydrolase [Paracidovorax citrulli]